jgi:hypothetical protein
MRNSKAESKHRNVRAMGVLLLATPIALSSMAFSETKVNRSQLPPAVEKTVQEQSQGATIKGFATETENGVFQYEAEMMVNGHSKDIAIAKDGTLLEVEEEVAMNALPDSIQKALTAKAGSAKITKVETLTKKGKLVAYEAATLKGTKKGELQVSPTGGKLAHEE